MSDYTHLCALPNTDIKVRNMIDQAGDAIIHIDLINPHDGQQVKITGYPDVMQTILDKLTEGITQATQGDRCKFCDGTGIVHSVTGDWSGACYCTTEGTAA